MEQLVTIQLFGRPYTFKAESEIAKAKEIADYFVQEVAKVEGKHTNKTSEIAKLAIVISTALQIASEHIELEKNYTMLMRDVSERSANLLRVLDENVR